MMMCGAGRRVMAIVILAGAAAWGTSAGVWGVQPADGAGGAAAMAYPLVPKEKRNAALIYAKVWMMLPNEMLVRARDVDWAALGDELDMTKLPESFRDVSALFLPGDATAFMLTAAATDRCDFELPIEDGPGTLLPHLGKMRQTASALRVMARRALSEGDTGRAAEACAALFGMARHMSQEPILISALVGNAIAQMGVDEVRVGLRQKRWKDADRRVILAALDRMDAGDPLGVRRAFVGERDMFIPWAEKNMGPGADLAWAKDFGLDAESTKKLKELVKSGEAPAELARLRELYNLVIDGWESPEAEAMLRALSMEVKDMKAGLLHKLFMADLVKPYRADREFRATAAELRRELGA